MKTAGYKLEFESEEAARKAFAVCEEKAENTGWQKKTGVFRDSVYVQTDTALAEDDFDEDGYEDGETLIQRICLALALRYPDMPFSGVCYFNDDGQELRIRISITHTEDYVRFMSRKTRPEKQVFHSVFWDRKPDGSLEKSSFGMLRERKRRQR